MNWFKGGIAEAVTESKAKNAIFVVYVEGKDESTRNLTSLLNQQRIRAKLETNDFVAIKIDSESDAYLQFAKIYQVVPVPSIFFIGKSGTPIEIGTGIISTVGELEQKIDHALVISGKNPHLMVGDSSSSFIAVEQQSTHQATSADRIVCEGDVCIKTTDVPTPSLPTTTTSKSAEPTTSTPTAADVEKDKGSDETQVNDAEARLEASRKLLEQKRREAVELERKQEKEQELERRRLGKELQNFQEQQRELELKELKENIRRERMEEQAARERIRAQIAADRAEREQRFSTETEGLATKSPSPPQPPAPPTPSDANVARLQFRLSSGVNQASTFHRDDTLSVVRAYVKAELLPNTGIKDFILATSYPKREFTSEDDSRTLVELGLLPSAVILVIGKESTGPAAIIRRNGGIIEIVSMLFWAMLSPMLSVFNYVKNVSGFGRGNGNRNTMQTGAQKRSNEETNAQHEAAKRRNFDRFTGGPSTSTSTGNEPSTKGGSGEQKPYRRYDASNIHRLTDNRKDSDDENATWNGNSTQQQ